jgi:solute carrier family 13 (sodium-dependent dicarboxylate transporter), member 2/3/5
MTLSHRIGFWGGLLVAFFIVGMSVPAQRAVAVTLLMAIRWLTEAIPIYATAFVPMALFPTAGGWGD